MQALHIIISRIVLASLTGKESNWVLAPTEKITFMTTVHALTCSRSLLGLWDSMHVRGGDGRSCYMAQFIPGASIGSIQHSVGSKPAFYLWR
jgi:hypothetical protein